MSNRKMIFHIFIYNLTINIIMRYICKLFLLILMIFPIYSKAQSTYFSQESNDYHFIDRLEIKHQSINHFNFSVAKPYNRKYVVEEVSLLDSQNQVSIKSILLSGILLTYNVVILLIHHYIPLLVIKCYLYYLT